jgi:hypothetical protein
MKGELMKDFDKKKDTVKVDKNEYDKLLKKVQELEDKKQSKTPAKKK